MGKRFLTTLALVGLSCSAAAAQIERIDAGDEAYVADELGLRQFTIQRLELPDEHTAFSTEISLGGEAHGVYVEPRSYRSPNATATLAGEGGVLTEIELPPSLTVRATLDREPEASAAGARENGGLNLIIVKTGNDGDEAWTVEPLSTVIHDADPSLHIVYLDEDQVVEGNYSCGVADHDHNHDHAGGINGDGGGGQRNFLVCELAFEADWEYYNIYNQSEANVIADIDLIMARVSAVYESQCNVTFVIPHYNIWTTSNDPYTSTDPSTRLGQFRSWWNNNKGNVHRDLAHFFTGANINGGVIGVAYLSVVCNISSGYGLSESRFTTGVNARGALTAHELGHNFSSGHCDGNGDCKIMCSGLGGCNGLGNPARFGAASATRITNYAASRNCLDEQGAPYPFLEEFAETTLDDEAWASSTGVINDGADNEPSAPYSMNLDAGDSLLSVDFDLSGLEDDPPFFGLFSQHKGVESGESLLVEYRDFFGDWQVFETITSDGNDESSFQSHFYEVPLLAWSETFAVRITAQGSDGSDDWYVDDIYLGPFVGNPVPFIEEFTSTNLSDTTWESSTGEVNGDASNEPSEPYSLNLDGSESATTRNFLMAGADFPTYVSVFTQHVGVENGESLLVEYLDLADQWVTLFTITSNGNDQGSFAFSQDSLNFDAYHDNFQLRFTAQGSDSTDDWYIDDIRIGDEFTPPDDCVADFNGDGEVNTLDVLEFLNAYTSGDPSADINGDGDVNTLDVLEFLNAWTAGCP